MRKSLLILNARRIIFNVSFIISLTFITANILKANSSKDLPEKPKKQKVTTANNSLNNFSLLPDGTIFDFWEDQTTYIKVLHVATNNPQASDNNPGTIEKPLKTINAAAQRLQPDEKVIVHEGIYRECIQPARGGTSPDKMIDYEAAEGENVIVKGSEIWKPQFRQSSGYQLQTEAKDVKIWMATIPEYFFKAYNPFLARDVYRYISEWGRPGEPEWMNRALLYRGSVYMDGKPMKQVLNYGELAKTENAFWVEDPGLRLHMHFANDLDTSKTFEITTREQLFAPKDFGLAYIKISGFAFEYAADGLPVPQRAAVSAMRGHHWIIENNRIEWVNACGLDIGSQTFDAEPMKIGGGHIVRNNIIRNIGICGIAGLKLDHTLIENNLIENVGYLDMERNCESAGLKFHEPHNTLIRQNIFRHIHHASGLWFDTNSENCRIANNVFVDIITLYAGVLMEINYEQNLIDHNIFWDIHKDKSYDPTPKPTEWAYGNGTAIRSDCNEKLIVAHNLFGKITEHAISLNLFQSMRIVEGRTGIGFANKVVNNVFFDCPNRIYLARKLENYIDGNLYDIKNDAGSFVLVYPEPYTFQNLNGWQDFFGFDKHSTQAKLITNFDPETCLLEISIEGDTPECQNLSTIMNGKINSGFPGPFNPDQTQKSQQIIKIKQKFPIEQ